MTAASFQPRFAASDEPEAQALTAERRMDMRRIAGKQHPASAVGIDKPRVVGPSAAVFERFHTDVRAADPAQHGFDLLACDRRLPIFRRTAEVQHDQPPG